MAEGQPYNALATPVSTDDDRLSVNGPAGDDANWPPNDRPKTTVLFSMFNLCNMIIGAGLLGLPKAVSQAGFGMGVILLIFVAWVTTYSLRLMIESGRAVRQREFEDLMSYCFGFKGYALNLFTIFFLDYGSMVAYLIIIGDTLSSVMVNCLGVSEGAKWGGFSLRVLIIVVCAIMPILILSFLKDLKSMAPISAISLVTVLGIIVIVAVQGFTDNDPTIKPAFGTIAFAYVCQDVAFQVFQSLENPTPARWSKTVYSAESVSFTISFLMGIFGYCSFFAKTDSNILNNLDPKGVFANIARCTMAICLFFKYPLNLFMCRHVVNVLMDHRYQPRVSVSNARAQAEHGELANGLVTSDNPYGDAEALIEKPPEPEFNLRRHIVVTTLLWASSVILSSLIKDLGAVQSFIGGFSAVALAFILPALCALKVRMMTLKVSAFSRETAGPLTLLVFGCVTMVASTASSVITYS